MKTANKTYRNLSLGLIVLLALIATPTIKATASTSPATSFLPYMLSDDEITNLLTYYSLEEFQQVELLKVEIYNKDFDLVYSDTDCQKLLECDKKLNRMINKSDFVTDFDNKVIYVLK